MPNANAGGLLANFLSGYLDQKNSNIAEENKRSFEMEKELQSRMAAAQKMREGYDLSLRNRRDIEAFKKNQEESKNNEKGLVMKQFANGDIDYNEAAYRYQKAGGDIRALETLSKMGDQQDPSRVAERAATAGDAFEEQGLSRDEGIRSVLGGKGKSTTNINIGDGSGNMPLDKPNITKQQTGILEDNDSLARLDEIEKSFKPEYQQIPTRVKMAYSALKSKAGFKLDPEDAKDLRDYTTFRASALDNLNRYIKQITGAQMSEKEAARLAATMPSPGLPEGTISEQLGDSPDEFAAKAQRVTNSLKLARARKAYALQHGIELNLDQENPSIPLDKTGSLINKDAALVESSLRQENPDMPDQEVRMKVKEYIKNVYGL